MQLPGQTARPLDRLHVAARTSIADSVRSFGSGFMVPGSGFWFKVHRAGDRRENPEPELGTLNQNLEPGTMNLEPNNHYLSTSNLMSRRAVSLPWRTSNVRR